MFSVKLEGNLWNRNKVTHERTIRKDNKAGSIWTGLYPYTYSSSPWQLSTELQFVEKQLLNISALIAENDLNAQYLIVGHKGPLTQKQ